MITQLAILVAVEARPTIRHRDYDFGRQQHKHQQSTDLDPTLIIGVQQQQLLTINNYGDLIENAAIKKLVINHASAVVPYSATNNLNTGESSTTGNDPINNYGVLLINALIEEEFIVNHALVKPHLAIQPYTATTNLDTRTKSSPTGDFLLSTASSMELKQQYQNKLLIINNDNGVVVENALIGQQWQHAINNGKILHIQHLHIVKCSSCVEQMR